MRLVFLGSPPFGVPVLRHLLNSEHEVAGVVTPPDRPRGRGRRTQPSPLAELADDQGVPLLRPESAREEGLEDTLRNLQAEVLLVASYGEILRQGMLDLAPRGAFNVHASLLPRWRGASPIQHAILAGDLQTGVSVQRIALALDAGDVLLERATSIGDEENAGELLARLAELGGKAAVEAMHVLDAGEGSLTPQDPAAVTLAPKLTKEDGWIDWSQPAPQLLRHIRAFTPWPGARTTLPDSRVLTVLRAQLDPSAEGPPGTLLTETGSLRVAAGSEGGVEMLEVQPAGKGPMDAAAFLRGARLDPKSRLGEC